jgi:dihydropteroate synthase
MQRTLSCNGQLVDLSIPKVMGILNLTPDSFYKESRVIADNDLLFQAEKMLSQGAAFLDIGGYSSRPGADFVTQEEELNRVLPAVKKIKKEFPDTLLSIDTFRSEVAYQCISEGGNLINDISGGSLDSKMFETVAKLQVPYIIMHMRGTPQTMGALTHYDNITTEITSYFSEKLNLAKKVGIHDVIIDPGFGFAKTRQQNFEILNHLEHFKLLEAPLLIGISRKSMIYKTLGIKPEQALNGTTVLHTLALQKGASILRVHDAKEALETIKLMQQF